MKEPSLLFTALAVAASAAVRAEPVTFEFAHGDQPTKVPTSRATTSDLAVIAAARPKFGKPFDARALHINGPIESAQGSENPPWLWRFAPGKWKLTHLEIELCDAAPVFLDENHCQMTRRWHYVLPVGISRPARDRALGKARNGIA